MRILTALALILASCSAPQTEPAAGPSKLEERSEESETRYYSFDDLLVDDDLVKPTHLQLVEPRVEASPDAVLLDKAEVFFSNNDLFNAKPLYEAVARGDDDALALYARYKLAWVHYNLGEFPEAMDYFAATAQGRGPDGQPTMLARQALSDTVFAFAEVGKPGHAPAFYKKMAPDEWRKYCDRLSQIYETEGKLDDAQALRDSLE